MIIQPQTSRIIDIKQLVLFLQLQYKQYQFIHTIQQIMLENRTALSNRSFKYPSQFVQAMQQQQLHPHTLHTASSDLSHTIFIKFIMYTGLLFVILSMISIPIWIGMYQCKHISLFLAKKYLRNYEIQQYGEMQDNIAMVGTLGHTVKLLQILKSKQQKRNTSKKSIFLQFMQKTQKYDYGMQAIIIIFCCILQYLIFRVKEDQKGDFIEDYSLEITGLPLLPAYIVQPKLIDIIEAELTKDNEVSDGLASVFDVDSCYAQHRYEEENLLQEIEGIQQMISQSLSTEEKSKYQGKLQSKRDRLDSIKVTYAERNTAWITFQTRVARYAAFRKFTSNIQLLGFKLSAKRAPHPLEINWNSLYEPKYKIIIFKAVSISIFIIILLLFDLAILYIHNSSYPILASVTIIVLEMLLKQIVLQVNKIQKHRKQSSLELSVFTKLTKYLYINTALIIFISSYDFGDNFLSDFFSSRKHRSLSYEWCQSVGFNITITSLIQVFYINIRLPIQYIKLKIFNRIFTKKPQQQLTADLDICYGHLVSALMVFNTYTYTHPILYIFALMLCFSAYFSHSLYMKKYAKQPAYNSNQIAYKSIQFILVSVIFHYIVVFLLTKELTAVILVGCLTLFVVFKNTIFSKIIGFCRKKNGPLCFISYRRNCVNERLENMLNKQQIISKIAWLQHKILIAEAEYYREYKNHGYVQKTYLQRYCHTLNKKINELKGQQYSDKKTEEQSLKKLHRKLNYSIQINQ